MSNTENGWSSRLRMSGRRGRRREAGREEEGVAGGARGEAEAREERGVVNEAEAPEGLKGREEGLEESLEERLGSRLMRLTERLEVGQAERLEEGVRAARRSEQFDCMYWTIPHLYV